MGVPVVDIWLVYEFIKRLTTPFDQTPAFRLGLIDAEGKRLRKPETPVEHRALGYYDRLVFNLKRLLGLLPAGKTRIASFAAALLLLKEKNEKYENIDELRVDLEESIANMTLAEYNYLSEEMAAAIANSTGAAVVGTGDNEAHWKKMKLKMGILKHGRSPSYGKPLSVKYSRDIARGVRYRKNKK